MSLGGLFAEKPAPRVIQRKLSSMGELIDTAIATVRGICADLRPPMLDELGLSTAIEWQAQQFEKRSGLRCRFVADGETRADTARSTALYRIVQESLTNVLRHAGAQKIEIELAQVDAQLRLTIRDDGRGIRPEQVTQQMSLGLRGMRERVETFGGDFQVRGIPGQGTVVTATIPMR
jgi:signal transduction histidine kinase